MLKVLIVLKTILFALKNNLRLIRPVASKARRAKFCRFYYLTESVV